MFRLIPLVAATAMLISAAPPLVAPAPLAPAGKWNVEYADNMCLLSRFYGDPAQPIALGFKPAPFADQVRIVLLAPAPKARVAFGTAKVGAGAAPPVDGRFSSGPTSTGMTRITAIDMKRSELAPLDGGGVLTIKAGKAADMAFRLDRPGAAFKALDRCVGNLLASWGMDEKEQAAVASFPEGVKPIFSYFTSSDYPYLALRAGQQGSSGVRYLVGTDGKATDCIPVETSGSALLDTTTCRLLTSRVRFKPALNHAGKPVRSLSYTRVSWVLGG